MSIKEKLNYFEGRFEEIKRERMAVDAKDQGIAREWVEWLKEQGLEGQINAVQLIKHFRKDKEIIT